MIPGSAKLNVCLTLQKIKGNALFNVVEKYLKCHNFRKIANSHFSSPDKAVFYFYVALFNVVEKRS